MTRYEKGERNPKDDRTLEIANILTILHNFSKKVLTLYINICYFYVD